MTLIGGGKRDWVLPEGVDFDVILSQSRMAHYPFLSRMANQLHLPLIQLEHTTVYSDWSKPMRNALLAMKGSENVFISESSRRAWGFDETNSVVLEHGIETEIFAPRDGPKKLACLSVVNEWKDRDKPCGYRFWMEATRGLPTVVFGDNPGLSRPAESVAELAGAYATNCIFVNTSLISPIPTALLEAMSSGAICVSTATCQIPDIIEDGINGLLCTSPEEMRIVLKDVLANPHAYEHLGRNAREYVKKRFGVERFVREWDTVLRRAAATPFLRRYYEGQ